MTQPAYEPQSAAEPHALYRFLDATGELLYVGITLNPVARWATHHREKPWWHEVATITIQAYADRAAALNAEGTAISSEDPRYNVRGQPRSLLPPRPVGLIANGDPDDIRAGLGEAGERLAEARRIKAEAMDEITVWLRRGQGVLSVTEMARLSGVTRETIYQILRSTNPSS